MGRRTGQVAVERPDDRHGQRRRRLAGQAVVGLEDRGDLDVVEQRVGGAAVRGDAQLEVAVGDLAAGAARLQAAALRAAGERGCRRGQRAVGQRIGWRRPSRPSVGSGPPACRSRCRFSAHGAEPNDDGATALVTVIGASTAWRADMFWSGHHDPGAARAPHGDARPALADPGRVERRLDRHLDPHAGGPLPTLGRLGRRHLYADRRRADRGDVHARRRPGGLPPAGERHRSPHRRRRPRSLRVAADGGDYALLYDVEIPSVFQPYDCLPGQAPPPLAVPIVGTLNSHLAGTPPHEEASAPSGRGWLLSATDTPDVAAAPGATVTASWDLRPRP